MADYLVTIKVPYQITARNMEQAKERASEIENAITFDFKKKSPRWLGDMDMIEVEVQEA